MVHWGGHLHHLEHPRHRTHPSLQCRAAQKSVLLFTVRVRKNPPPGYQERPSAEWVVFGLLILLRYLLRTVYHVRVSRLRLSHMRDVHTRRNSHGCMGQVGGESAGSTKADGREAVGTRPIRQAAGGRRLGEK